MWRPIYSIDPTLINDTLYYRAKYSRDINKCINLDLKERYGLMGYSIVDFCNSNKDVVEYDFWDYLFVTIFFSVILTVVLGTYYDKSLNDSETMLHYQKDIIDGRK